MSNKTIFFLLGSLKLGGTEVVASRIGKELTNKGFVIKYILLKDIREIDVSSEGDNVISLGAEKYKHKSVKFFFALINFWKAYIRLRPKYVVSFSSGMNLFLLASLVPRQVWTVDTNLFWVKSKLYRRWILKYVGWLPFVKKVVIPSHGLRLRFASYLSSISYKKLITIYNPVVISKSAFEKSSSNTNTIVCVGRLTRGKGSEQLIRCFLNSKISYETTLKFYGTGKYESKIKETIIKYKGEDRVKLMGFHKDVVSEISTSRCLVLNSYFESFGNVLIEALSVGVPVISNDCDFGPREIIDNNKNGILIDNNSDENLIRAIERIFNDDAFYKDLKSNTSKNLERFSISNLSDIWIKDVLN